MTKDEFILWLHGFFEISNAKTLNEEQTALIRGEVEKFFHKVTPVRIPESNPDRTDFMPTPLIPPAQTPNWPKYDPNIHKWTPGWETPQITCGLKPGESSETTPLTPQWDYTKITCGATAEQDPLKIQYITC